MDGYGKESSIFKGVNTLQVWHRDIPFSVHNGLGKLLYPNMAPIKNDLLRGCHTTTRLLPDDSASPYHV
jgi:hypothetical protein